MSRCARQVRDPVDAIVRATCIAAVLLSASSPGVSKDFPIYGQEGVEDLKRHLEAAGLSHGLGQGLQRERYPQLPDADFLLLQRYFNECESLRSLYSNLQMSGRLERVLVAKGEEVQASSPREAGSFSYCSAGLKNFRLDLHWTTPVGQEYSVVGVISPDEQFLLQTDLQTGKPFLKGESQNLHAAFYQFCQFSPHHLPFSDAERVPVVYRVFFPAPEPLRGRVTSVAKASAEDGEEIVRIIWTNERTGSQRVYDLIPSLQWALKQNRREAVWIDPQDSSRSYAFRDLVNCVYERDSENRPLLKKCVRELWWSADPDLTTLKLFQRDIVNVESITPVPAPAVAFNKYALLGRESSLPTDRPVQYWWILFLNGFALFLVGAYLTRRRRGNQAVTKSPSSSVSDRPDPVERSPS